MSAFMMGNRELTIIAKYMAECANNREMGMLGRVETISRIEFGNSMLDYLRANGCYDSGSGLYLAGIIHQVLVRENRKALAARYADSEEMVGGNEYNMMEREIRIDTRKETRKEWLSNLYTVVRCYQYQIAEGDYKNNPLYNELERWIADMAVALAKYTVETVRPEFPQKGQPWKSWSEF